SWKQKRGISAPAASHAWRSVYSGGTSTSLLSTLITGMAWPSQIVFPAPLDRRSAEHVGACPYLFGEVADQRVADLVGQNQLRRLALAVEPGLEVAARLAWIGPEEPEDARPEARRV